MTLEPPSYWYTGVECPECAADVDTPQDADYEECPACGAEFDPSYLLFSEPDQDLP